MITKNNEEAAAEIERLHLVDEQNSCLRETNAALRDKAYACLDAPWITKENESLRAEVKRLATENVRVRNRLERVSDALYEKPWIDDDSTALEHPLRARVAELEEALRFYADPDIYFGGGCSLLSEDNHGDKARTALGVPDEK